MRFQRSVKKTQGVSRGRPPSRYNSRRMDATRIAQLLEPFLGESVLSVNQLQDISTYIDILQRWNARLNLTAIRNPDEMVTRHFGESFFAARHLFPNPSAYSVSSAARAFELADVGSGAGFPGIPIKLWAPHISLTLIESNHKKATFLREVTRALTLTNVNIQNIRAESLTGKKFDVVTLRAVERFESTLPIAVSLLNPRGCLALLIGSSQLPTAQATLPSLNWREPVVVPASDSRILLMSSLPS
jgi:16S rRNA (guanine527-N7)-methyltransferase